jgi:hypothetical protein
MESSKVEVKKNVYDLYLKTDFKMLVCDDWGEELDKLDKQA